MYQPKIVLCLLKTGGKTIEEIREKHKGQGLTYRDFENMQKAYEEFDGLEVYLSLWEYDNYRSYHLYGYDNEIDEKMMMGTYYSEQTHPFPQYIDKIEEFITDWKSGEYDPGCSFCFDPEDVEEIEVYREEVKEEVKNNEGKGIPKKQRRSGTGGKKKKRRKH